jgi:outer membrane lipoprotein-sorting protein
MDNNTHRRLLILVIVAAVQFILTSCAGYNPPVITDLETLLKDAERKAYIIRQFKTDFTKTKKSHEFRDELKVHGTLIFQKPGNYRLSYTGAVYVEIVSNGKLIKLIHDGRDEETYQVLGDRDLSRFSDPLMTLVSGIGSGGLRKFSITSNFKVDNSVVLKISPSNMDSEFERIESATIRFSSVGEIDEIDIRYKNGDEDRTLFESWLLLAPDGPEIIELNEKLRKLNG